MSFWKVNAAPAEQPQSPKASDFWVQAKGTFQDVFRSYASREEEFDSLQAFLEALAKDAWKIAEQLVKVSFANGLARGKARRGK